MAVIDTIAAVRRAIEAAKPTIWPDRGFAAPRGAIGESAEGWIRDADARALREFVVRLAELPTTTDSACFRRYSLAIEVAYPGDIPEDLRDGILAEDAMAIQCAILRWPSADWGGADIVEPSGVPTLEAEVDDTDREVLYVLQISVNVIQHV